MIIGIHALGAISEDTGARTYLQNMIRILNKNEFDHEFIFFVSPGEGRILTVLSARIRLVEIPFSRSSIGRILIENVFLPFYLYRYTIDVLYYPGNFAAIFTPVPYLLAIRSMLIYNIQDDGSVSRLKRIYRRIMLPYSAKKASAILTPSKHTKEEIVHFLSIDAHKISIVPHGVDVDFFEKPISPSETAIFMHSLQIDRPFLLYVSALWEYKNHDKLILAFEKLIRNHDIPHRLLLVGRGVNSFEKYGAYLKSLTLKLGLESRVKFIGNLNHNELRMLYQNVDVYVFPSQTESFGNSIFEAMAAGAPVVCSNTHGFPALVEDSALLANPQDIENLAATIYRVITDVDLRNSMIAKGHARVRPMTWEKAISATIASIENLTKRSR